MHKNILNTSEGEKAKQLSERSLYKLKDLPCSEFYWEF